eukprot:g26483.t1
MGFCSTWPSGASSLLVHESGLAETPSGFAESIGRCDQGTQSTGVNEIPPDLTGELAALQEHCSACDALEEKVSSLVPCLHGDYPTTRLVVALAAMEMGQDLARHGELPGPFQSLSSADVCWGLVSEKRRLVLETLLGSGPVSWPELRCSNVAYWLGTRQAQSLELVEFLLTRLVQSSLAKLRSNTQGGSLEMSDAQAEARSNSRRQNIDEAVFWSVVLGSNVTKLRALLRTGAKTARELHRFHLSAALFLLSGAPEEAALVLSNHLKDLQLVIIVTRRHQDVCAGILKNVRYALQSSILPEMRTDLDKDVLDREWHLTSPVDLQPRHLNRSSRCEFELPTSAELLDGGVYIFQVRLGNGKNWSQWSHSSKPFIFQVPPPVVPTAASLKAQRTVNVEVMSATAARVVWGDFKPAPGLTMLEYEVRATPEKGTGSSQAFPPHWITFEHRYRGGFIEHELFNLLPFTYYIFSVQARYPKVGTRAWSGQQLSHPIILEPAVAYQDPPTPLPVPERAEEENRCYTIVEFPCEEEDMHYDLEYAHVLGDELDTAELRSINSLWRAPAEVTLLDLGRPGPSGGHPQPRWRVQLPDIRNLRGDVLKLALLQRVRFRLRARITPEADGEVIQRVRLGSSVLGR